MNLRKSRFISEQKRNPLLKDIKSSFLKGTRIAKSNRHSQKNSQETPLKRQKLVLDDILNIRYSPCSASHLNLLTSTPIPNGVRKRTRPSRKCALDKTVSLRSFNKLSCAIPSTPIQKTFIEVQSCKVMLSPLAKPRGQRYSDEGESDRILRYNKKSSNKKSSNSNISLEILGETRSRSTRSSLTLSHQNVSKKMLNDSKALLSRKSKSKKNISIAKKYLSNSQKPVENHIVHQNESKNTKYLKNSSICAEQLPVPSTSRDKSSMSDKSKKISIAKKFPNEVSGISRDSLIQSYHETENSKSSRYSLRNSVVPQKKSSCYRKVKGSKSLPQSGKETESFKSSRCSLRLQNQYLFKRASSNRLPSDSLILQDITKTPKSVLEPICDGEKRSSRHSLRLKEKQSSKKTTVNKSSSEHTSKKTSTKKQTVKTFHQNKKSSSSSKKKMSSKKSTILNFRSLQDIPVDDLAKKENSSNKRKVKSDGFKLPGKNTLKRKRSAIEAVINADEDYEDDLYESKKFDKFKDLLMDTSESERSFSVSTPKFPCTPLIRHKTPKFKDFFSPGEYAISRKAALEYIYRNKNRKSGEPIPEIPVMAEKKRLEYSQVLEDAQKLKKTFESLAEEESDDDSYFSF